MTLLNQNDMCLPGLELYLILVESKLGVDMLTHNLSLYIILAFCERLTDNSNDLKCMETKNN